MKIGYARVSTDKQHTDSQAANLKEAGCEVVYTELGASGAKASRPEWDKALAQLRKGDVLVCTKLDRIGRSLQNLITVSQHLKVTGVQLVVLDQGIDTTTAQGELFFHLIGAFAQFELSLIQERTREGLTAARERHGGRLPTHGNSAMKPEKLKAAQALLDTGQPVGQVASVIGVSRATVYRHISSGALVQPVVGLAGTGRLSAGGGAIAPAAALTGVGTLTVGGVRAAVQELHEWSREDLQRLLDSYIRDREREGAAEALAAQVATAGKPSLAKLIGAGVKFGITAIIMTMIGAPVDHAMDDLMHWTPPSITKVQQMSPAQMDELSREIIRQLQKMQQDRARQRGHDDSPAAPRRTAGQGQGMDSP